MTNRLTIIQQIQERLLADDRVCEVLGMDSDQFWNEILTEEERQVLHDEKTQLVSICIYDPVRKVVFESSRPDYLSDDSMSSRLYKAMVEAGAVSLRVGEEENPVEMSEGMLTELIEGDEKFEMDFGAFVIAFEDVQK